MSTRAAPFYCPYCGEEALEPRAGVDDWFCESCDRQFVLRFEGLAGGET